GGQSDARQLADRGYDRDGVRRAPSGAAEVSGLLAVHHGPRRDASRQDVRGPGRPRAGANADGQDLLVAAVRHGHRSLRCGMDDRRAAKSVMAKSVMGGHAMSNTIKLHRVLRAAPEKVYRAFLDGDAMAKWLPPNGFTARVHHLESKVGGTYKCRCRRL